MMVSTSRRDAGIRESLRRVKDFDIIGNFTRHSDKDHVLTARLMDVDLGSTTPGYKETMNTMTFLVELQVYNWETLSDADIDAILSEVRRHGMPGPPTNIKFERDNTFRQCIKMFYCYFCKIDDDNPQKIIYDKNFFTDYYNLHKNSLKISKCHMTALEIGFFENMAKYMKSHEIDTCKNTAIDWMSTVISLFSEQIQSRAQIESSWTDLVFPQFLRNLYGSDVNDFNSLLSYRLFLQFITLNLSRPIITYPSLEDAFITRLMVSSKQFQENQEKCFTSSSSSSSCMSDATTISDYEVPKRKKTTLKRAPKRKAIRQMDYEESDSDIQPAKGKKQLLNKRHL